jgi:DNA-binding NtrC family response regulator
MKRGAVDFLVKPVDEDTLFQALEHAISRQTAEASVQHLGGFCPNARKSAVGLMPCRT